MTLKHGIPYQTSEDKIVTKSVVKKFIGVGVLCLLGYNAGKWAFTESDDEKNVPAIQQSVEHNTNDDLYQRLEELIEQKKSIEQKQTIEQKSAVPTQIRRIEPAHQKDQLEQILDGYNVAIVDGTVKLPMQLNKEMYEQAQKYRTISDESRRAEELFDWVTSNISYGDSNRESGVGYRDSVETLRDKEGVCGESTYLYVTMARAADLNVKYAHVYKDVFGKDVKHACAVVELDGRTVLADPAYRLFDARHEKYELISDEQAKENFKKWRASHGKCSRN